MNKRILYIGGFTMPDGNAAAQRVLGIAKILRDCSYDVKFCGLKNLPNNKIDEGEIDEFQYINYPYPCTFKNWLSYLRGRDGMLDEIKKYNPEIVILYNHPAIASEYITKYCHRNHIRVLGDVTEWYVPYGNPIFKIIKGFDIKRRMYHSLLRLDGLICISSYLTKFYRDKGCHVVEIPPLVDLKQSKWHQPKSSSYDGKRIIYAGSPSDNKDRLDLIIQAMDEIPDNLKKDIKFEVFGLTEEQYQKKWNDKKKREYVIFRGRVSHNNVIAHLTNADFQIFLRPDTLQNKAGFPTKFVETISSCTIPITNLNSNIGQYVKDGINGFIVEQIDKDSIKSTLCRALSLDREGIEEIKNNIDTNIFHYEFYLTALDTLLQ